MANPNQHYQIQEGTLIIPHWLEDRTINTFVHSVSGQVKFNVTIEHDKPLPDEIVQDYLTRQIALLKKNMPSYKLAQRTPATLGALDNAIPGEQVSSTYKSGQQTVFQRQAAFIIQA